MAKPHPMLGPDIRIQDSGGSCGTPTGSARECRALDRSEHPPAGISERRVGAQSVPPLRLHARRFRSRGNAAEPCLGPSLYLEGRSHSLAVSNVALGSLSASLPCRGVPCTDEDSRSVPRVSRLRAPMHARRVTRTPRSGTVGGGIGDERYRTLRGVRHRASPRLGPLSSVSYRVPVGRRGWLWRRCRRGP